MTNTIQLPPAIETESASSPKFVIGVHLTLRPDVFWFLDDLRLKMLSRILYGVLDRRGLLVPVNDFEKDGFFKLFAWENQVTGMATVKNYSQAILSVAAELTIFDLEKYAHLAWLPFPNGCWQTERPLPEPTYWQNHFDDMAKWYPAHSIDRILRERFKVLPGVRDIADLPTHELLNLSRTLSARLTSWKHKTSQRQALCSESAEDGNNLFSVNTADLPRVCADCSLTAK